MADVFLSYARGDFDEARRFAARLMSCGYSLWFDENLPAHRAYSEVITRENISIVRRTSEPRSTGADCGSSPRA